MPCVVPGRRALASRYQHEPACPVRIGQRYEQPSARFVERVEPCQRQMRHAGIDDDGIRRPLGAEREAVRGHDMRLWPISRQVCLRTRSEHRIDLNRCDRAAVADNVSEDGTVVTGADADMHHMVTPAEIKLVIEECPQARLAIVQSARFVDRDQHVVAQVTRVGILCCPVVPQIPGAQQAPWPGSGEMLPRYAGECIDDRRRSYARDMPQFLGEPAARNGDFVVGHPAQLFALPCIVVAVTIRSTRSATGRVPSRRSTRLRRAFSQVS